MDIVSNTSDINKQNTKSTPSVEITRGNNAQSVTVNS